MSGQASSERISPAGPRVKGSRIRSILVAVSAVVLSLIFAGALSRDAWPFWANFTGQLIAFVLAGFVAALIARRRAGLVVAIGLGVVWLPILLATHSRVPTRDSVAIAVYVVAGVAAAEGLGRWRARQSSRRSN